MTAEVLERPTTRGTMSIPDRTGDSRITWDPDDAGEVEVAQAAFDAARAKGMLAYRRHGRGDGTLGEVIRKFDPCAGEITLSRQIVGG